MRSAEVIWHPENLELIQPRAMVEWLRQAK